MITDIIVDTGPLVAFFDRRETHHERVKLQFANIKPPILTCEAVLSETCFLLKKINGATDMLLECLHRKLIDIAFTLREETTAIRKLLDRYKDVPMSLADACLVRMAEHYDSSTIFTLDSDFHIYRKHGRQVIPLITLK